MSLHSEVIRSISDSSNTITPIRCTRPRLMIEIGGVIEIHDAILFQKLQRGLVIERLMKPYTIMNILPLSQLFIKLRNTPRTIVHHIKLLRMS